ncbi:MAG: DUF4160 domain-containing protein [Thioploca sp.]|nr:DUF4160 domain-containing protein [Thioploca sp.]
MADWHCQVELGNELIDTEPHPIWIGETKQDLLYATNSFFGISIYMYMDDHGVPHCHGIYGDYAGAFNLQDGELLAGQMPPK